MKPKKNSQVMRWYCRNQNHEKQRPGWLHDHKEVVRSSKHNESRWKEAKSHKLKSQEMKGNTFLWL
jgi:hypothetical protein